MPAYPMDCTSRSNHYHLSIIPVPPVKWWYHYLIEIDKQDKTMNIEDQVLDGPFKNDEGDYFYEISDKRESGLTIIARLYILEELVSFYLINATGDTLECLHLEHPLLSDGVQYRNGWVIMNELAKDHE